MTNIRKWIEHVSTQLEEPIESIAIDGNDWLYDLPFDDFRHFETEEGLAILDYEFVNEYGENRCPTVLAWTSSRVLFVDGYDGKLSLRWVPRHPEK